MKYDVDKLLKSVFSDDDQFDVRTAFDTKLVEYNLSKSKNF